jgi:hypothetical protein
LWHVGHNHRLRRIGPDRPWAINLIITVIGLTLFAGLTVRSGRIDANDGLGWDGRQYAHMVTGGLQDGTIATQTRPLIPLLARLPYRAGLDVRPAFQLMNFVYAAVLYFFVCLMLDLYKIEVRYKVYLVATVATCIATAKMFAFYPVLIGLGALAIMTASSYVVLTRAGWPAGAAVLLAVIAREFGVALALLGLHREVRHGRGIVRPLLTYGPALGAFFLIRQWAVATNVGDRRPLLGAGDYLANLELWREPAFAGFFVYFTLTLLGGVTMMLAVRPVWTGRTLARTPELVTFTLFIGAVAVLGNADIWRYLVFLLPALVMLFAAYVSEHRPGPLLLGGALLLTILTQQPFAQMDMTQYFQAWFPGYIHMTDDATESFWSAWRTRAIVVAAGMMALWVVQRVERSPDLRPPGTASPTGTAA